MCCYEWCQHREVSNELFLGFGEQTEQKFGCPHHEAKNGVGEIQARISRRVRRSPWFDQQRETSAGWETPNSRGTAAKRNCKSSKARGSDLVNHTGETSHSQNFTCWIASSIGFETHDTIDNLSHKISIGIQCLAKRTSVFSCSSFCLTHVQNPVFGKNFTSKVNHLIRHTRFVQTISITKLFSMVFIFQTFLQNKLAYRIKFFLKIVHCRWFDADLMIFFRLLKNTNQLQQCEQHSSWVADTKTSSFEQSVQDAKLWIAQISEYFRRGFLTTWCKDCSRLFQKATNNVFAHYCTRGIYKQ